MPSRNKLKESRNAAACLQLRKEATNSIGLAGKEEERRSATVSLGSGRSSIDCGWRGPCLHFNSIWLPGSGCWELGPSAWGAQPLRKPHWDGLIMSWGYIFADFKRKREWGSRYSRKSQTIVGWRAQKCIQGCTCFGLRSASAEPCGTLFFSFKYLFIYFYFWLRWVLVVACGISVEAYGIFRCITGSSLQRMGFSLVVVCGFFLFSSCGVQAQGTWAL